MSFSPSKSGSGFSSSRVEVVRLIWPEAAKKVEKRKPEKKSSKKSTKTCIQCVCGEGARVS